MKVHKIALFLLIVTTSLFPDNEPLFLIKNINGYVFINRQGKVIIDESYGVASDFTEGLAAVIKNGLYGFMDKSAKLIIPHKFRNFKNFSEGLAAVETNSGWGFIDHSGNFAIPPCPNDVGYFSEGRAWIQDNWCTLPMSNSDNSNNSVRSCPAGPYGFIDRKGKIVIPIKYFCTHFHEGLSACGYNKKYGFLDLNGNVKIPFQFDFAKSFSNGFAVIEKNKRYGYIDKTGSIVIQPVFWNAGDFEADRASVQINRDAPWSYIDKKGNPIVNKRWSIISSYSEGLAIIVVNNKYGYVDIQGNIKIQPRFLKAHPFQNGLALVVTHDSQWNYLEAYINTNGDFVYKSNFKKPI